MRKQTESDTPSLGSSNAALNLRSQASVQVEWALETLLAHIESSLNVTGRNVAFKKQDCKGVVDIGYPHNIPLPSKGLKGGCGYRGL